MMTTNFHNHTYRCFHAGGEDEEYVLSAIENGFDEIGFSDHCAWRFDSDYVSGMRMSEDQIGEYVASVRSLSEKYADKIKIHLGWEVEYFKKHLPWMIETLSRFDFDYIILGHHFGGDEPGGVYNGAMKTEEDLECYVCEVCEAMESGLFTYLAHPDLYMRGRFEFDETARSAGERIIRKSIETATPLEFNLLGLEYRSVYGEKDGYPFPEFWALAAEMGATAIIGLDAHQPGKYANREFIEKGEKSLKETGIRVIERPEFRKKW